MQQEVNKTKNIFINGKKINIELEENQKISSVIEKINQEISKENLVVTGFEINGQFVAEADHNQYLDESLELFENINFIATTPIDLAYETINTLELYLDRLINSIERAGIHYKNMNLVAAESYLAKAIDGLDLFIQTIGGIKMALKFGLNQKVALIEADLVSIMNEILNAKRQNNYIYLSEILSKDLIENLYQWKEVAFPIFKTWKTA
jgi:hypothetical protein